MSSASSHSPEKKDSDFFTEHTQVSSSKEYFRLFLTGGLLTKAKAFCGHVCRFSLPWCDTADRECWGPPAG